MTKMECLKSEIEKERKKLDDMLNGGTMQEALAQSRRLDRLMEEYISLNG